MPLPAILGAAAPIVGGAIGSAIGGGGPSNAQPVLPKDLQPLRAQNIGLLQYLLGYNQPGMPWSLPQPQAPGGQPGGGSSSPWNSGLGFPSNTPGGYFNTPLPTYMGGARQRGGSSLPQGPNMDPADAWNRLVNMGYTPVSGTTNPNTGVVGGGGGGAGANNPLGRMESFFGPLGVPTTALQQQSLGGMSQFLGSNPYGASNNALQQLMGGGNFGGSNAAYGGAADIFRNLSTFNPLGAAQSAMEGQLGTNPGQGVLDALRPMFDRNLAAANQTGGRFGSANAIRTARAADDWNLLGAQTLQRGVDQQQNAANILGMLGQTLGGFQNQAGQGMLGVGGGLGQNAAQAGQQGISAAGQLANNATSQGNMFNQAYGMGSQQATQEAQRQQQALQILMQMLGTSFGATLGTQNQVSPTGGQQGANFGSQIGQVLATMNNGSNMIPPAPILNPFDLTNNGAPGFAV